MQLLSNRLFRMPQVSRGMVTIGRAISARSFSIRVKLRMRNYFQLVRGANSNYSKGSINKSLVSDDALLFKSYEFALRTYFTCRIYSNGEIVQKMCSMPSLMTEYGLHGRDFLAIHPGTHRTTPCILARQKAILVNLNSIRSIISDESMIIFNVIVSALSMIRRLITRSFQRYREISRTTFG